MSTPFVYNATYQVLICTICAGCIKPSKSSQSGHLRKEVHGLKGKPLQATLALFANHPHINGPEDAPRPLVPVPAIPQLPVVQVYGCQLCDTWPPVQTLETLQQHIRFIHRVDTHEQQLDTHFRHFPAQTWFREPKDRYYFEVIPATTSAAIIPANPVQSAFFEENRVRREQEAAASRDAATTIVGFGSHQSEVLPWAKSLGLEEYLTGLPVQAILDSARLSHSKGANHCTWFPFIVNQIYAVLEEAHSFTLGAKDVLTRSTLYLLTHDGAADTRQATQHTWQRHLQPGTLRKYFRTWADFVLYYLSIHLGTYAADVDVPPHQYWWPDLTERPEGTTIPQDSLVLSPVEQRLCAELYTAAHAIDASVEVDAEVAGHVRNLLVQLFEVILKTPTGLNAFSSTLVSFAALLSQQPSTKGWIAPGGLSSSLSGIIWVSQLLLFDACRRDCGDQIQVPGLLNQKVDELFRRVARQNRETPVGTLLNWRDLLMTASKGTVQDRGFTYGDGRSVTFGSISLHIDDISRLVVQEYDLAHKLLYDDLMFGALGITRLKAYQLKDDSRNHIDGVSLVDINKDHVPLNPYKLEEVIENSASLRQTWVQSYQHSACWRRDAILQHEAYVQSFLKHLLVLVHVSAGQPLRSSELLSVKWRNTQAWPRNIFVHDRHVMLRTAYHKGMSSTGKVKDNMRFLPGPIGDLLLDFLVYVQPFRVEVIRHAFPKEPLSAFLWSAAGSSEPWGQDSVTECMKAACSIAVLPPVGVREWRQITVALCTVHFNPFKSLFDLDDQEDCTEAEAQYRAITLQRNHLPDTANRSYANQHSYGNLADDDVHRNLTASTLWHGLLGLSGSLLAASRRPREELGSDDELGHFVKRVMNTRPRERTTYTDKELTLKAAELLGTPGFSWRPGQQALLRAILQGRKDIVAILPTGSGKSLAFMLPCKLPDAKITVLVLPLVSLRVDMVRRLRELRIDFSVWSPHSQATSRLVIVSVEAAITTGFRSYVEHLHNTQELDRIVIDECHLTVTARDYRESMTQLCQLRWVETQFVFLTATLPPSLVPQFFQHNYLGKPYIVRQLFNRPSIRYCVIRSDDRSTTLEQEAAKEMRAQHRQNLIRGSYSPRDKVIAYCPSRLQAKVLAGYLDCEHFTSDSGTPEDKKAILDRWLADADMPYIVATSALGAGFDYAHIRTVWHVGAPTSMVDFVQETGRAGRDGEPAASLVLLDVAWKPDPDADIGLCMPACDAQAMQAYLEPDSRCLRVKIAEYIDGVDAGQPTCQDAHFACSNCRSALLHGSGSPTPQANHPFGYPLVNLLQPNPFVLATSGPYASRVATPRFVSSRTLLDTKPDQCRDSVNSSGRNALADVSPNRGVFDSPSMHRVPSKMASPSLVGASENLSVKSDELSEWELVPTAGALAELSAGATWELTPTPQAGSSNITSPSPLRIEPLRPLNPGHGRKFALHSPSRPSVEPIDLTTESSSPVRASSRPALATSNPRPSSPSFASSAVTPPSLDNLSRSSARHASSASSLATPTGRTLLLTEAKRTQMKVDRFREDLQCFVGTCAYCRGRHREFGHEFESCPFRNDFLYQKKEFTGNSWLKPYTCCYLCYLPQSVCSRPARSGQSPTNGSTTDRGKCSFRDVLLPWLFGTWERDADSLYYEFEEKVNTVADFFKWVAVRTDVGREKWTRGAVFMAGHLAEHPLY